MPDGRTSSATASGAWTSRKARSRTSRTASRPRARARIPSAGSHRFRALDAGDKVRERSETFADHYSQPRLFYRSMSEPEQRHIVNAFTFELSKVSRPNIRQRMLGHLKNIDADLCARVEDGLGMEGQAENIKPARAPIDMKPSPALSLVKKAPKTLEGRKVGVLVTDGSDPGVRRRVANGRREGRRAAAGRRAEDRRRQRQRRQADRGRSSARRRTVDLLRCRRRRGVDRRALMLEKEAAAIDWIRDAFGHLKVIGVLDSSLGLAEEAGRRRGRRGRRNGRHEGHRGVHQRGEKRPRLGSRAEAAEPEVKGILRGDAGAECFSLSRVSASQRLCGET